MSGDALAEDQDSTGSAIEDEIGMTSTIDEDPQQESSQKSGGFVIPRRLNAKQYSKLKNDSDRALYQEDDKGNYIFMAENAQELRRAKDRIAADRNKDRELVKQLQSKLDAVNAQNQEEAFEDAKSKGDVKKLEASYRARLDSIERKYKADLIKAQETAKKHRSEHLSYRRDREVDRLANEIAGELAVSPFALMPHIKSRLEYYYNEDSNEDQIYVLDEFGNRTHDTPDTLKKTLREDQRLAALIKVVADPDGVAADNYHSSGILTPSTADGGRQFGRPSVGGKKLDLTDFDSSDPNQRKAFAKYIEQKTANRLRRQGRR